MHTKIYNRGHTYVSFKAQSRYDPKILQSVFGIYEIPPPFPIRFIDAYQDLQ
jgi:hypothetical protein